MILVRLARLLDRISRRCEHWATALYRADSRVQALRAARLCAERRRERERRDAIAINDLIQETRPKGAKR